MLKKLLKGGLIMTVILIAGCSNDSSTIQKKENQSIQSADESKQDNDKTVNNKKTLIAYFSRVGNTDFPDDVDANSSASLLTDNDQIVGNTQHLANMIQQNTNGDLFLIQTTKKYPADYDETDALGRTESQIKPKLQLATHIDNLDEYDTIFIGFPNWYYDMPRAVYAFLEEYDFSGKTIVPFCTSGGSGFADSISEIQSLEPNANVITNGLTVTHSQIAKLDLNTVSEWINSLNLNKDEKL